MGCLKLSYLEHEKTIAPSNGNRSICGQLKTVLLSCLILFFLTLLSSGCISTKKHSGEFDYLDGSKWMIKTIEDSSGFLHWPDKVKLYVDFRHRSFKRLKHSRYSIGDLNVYSNINKFDDIHKKYYINIRTSYYSLALDTPAIVSFRWVSFKAEQYLSMYDPRLSSALNKGLNDKFNLDFFDDTLILTSRCDNFYRKTSFLEINLTKIQ